MQKFIPILAAILALPGFAAAAEPGVVSGEVTVAFGWVKNPDGSKRNIAGIKLPYRAYRVKTKVLDPKVMFGKAKGNSFAEKFGLKSALDSMESGPGALQSNQVVYMADAGVGYGYVENNPSSLDDITMVSAGSGKPWSTLTFGFQKNSTPPQDYIVRWRCFGTNVDNPPGQNDFTDEFADFGVRWPRGWDNGGTVVEIDIAQAAVSTTDTSFYVAQQFREPSPNGPFGTENGEGAFHTGTVDTVFNAFAPPTTGTSADQFWYDWDPQPDGKYENTEIDIFEGSVANHVLVIKVDGAGTTTSLLPIDVRMGIGRNPSGNLQSIVNQDANFFKVNQSYLVSRDSPVGAIEVDFWQVATNVTGIRLSGRAGVTITGCDAALDLFNFNTGTWVQVNAWPASNGFNTFNEAYGGTVPLDQFVGPINHPFFGTVDAIRARVRFKNTTYILPRDWEMRLDQLQCLVTSSE